MKRLETTILKNLIFNEEYARKILPFIKTEYFTDNVEKIVFNEINEHIHQYKHLPTYESLVINFTESKKLTEEQVQDSVQMIREINAEKEEPTDTDWLINQTEKFCQDRALYNAIMQSVKILDDKNGKEEKGSIPKLLSDALGVSFDSSVGHDYMDDANSRYDFYHRHETKIPFDLDLFNKITKGGLPKKTLNIALAGTGVGKSLFMCHVAGACLAQGLNVLYITMEMAE
jgi:replicative DNA helicase